MPTRAHPRAASRPHRRTPASALAAATALAALAVLLAACPQPPTGGFLLPFDAKAGVTPTEDDYETLGIRFSQAPAAGELTVDRERRPVVLTSEAGWTWRGRLPEGARLRVGVQAVDEAWQRARQLTARVAVRDGGGEQVLVEESVARGERDRWLDFAVDLGGLAGEVVTLQLSAELAGADARGERWIAWGPVALAGSAAGDRPRPNVVVVVVDTLRADHLGAYGYERPTSPAIDARLAARGTLFEDAYAQAPWTLPSVLSYLTGRTPGELARPEEGPFVVPESAPTLAERLRQAGYRTAAFVANPTLAPSGSFDLGFDRGFETWWAPPAEPASLSLGGEAVNRRALPWLDAHAASPFFLYLHYMDPHDPYAPPDTGAAESPFLPGYEGEIEGTMVHGVYVGEVELADPEADRRQLAALYDAEIAYVDERIGELLDAFPEALARETLFVFTSDHGEELGDHGGWKHGHTLYNEQIRVPLVFRWDGRVRDGNRVSGSVRLLDLVPTVLSAAGLDLPPELDGADLMPVLTGMATLPRRVAMAEGLSFGPLRAAAVLDQWKLILFNREEPFEPADPLQAATWPLDRERLERIELYDLAADPGETVDLSAAAPDRVEQLAPAIHSQLDRELPGLKVVLDRVAAGSRVTGIVVLDAEPAGVVPYFLAAGDEIAVDGRTVRFAWRADVLQKGMRITGEVGGVESLAVEVEGRPVPAARILFGPGNPYRGRALPPRRLLSSDWPFATSVPTTPVLRVWRRQPAVEEARAGAADATDTDAAAEEERRRLKALGYAG